MGNVCRSLPHVRYCDIPWPANLAITQIRCNNCDEWRNCSLFVLLSPNKDTGHNEHDHDLHECQEGCYSCGEGYGEVE